MSHETDILHEEWIMSEAKKKAKFFTRKCDQSTCYACILEQFSLSYSSNPEVISKTSKYRLLGSNH